MKITLLTGMSFGDGVTTPVGSVREVSDAQGQALIDLGLAVAYKAVPETATLEDPPERATLPRGRKR